MSPASGTSPATDPEQHRPAAPALRDLVDDAVDLAARWRQAAARGVDRRAAAGAERLARLVSDPAGLALAVAFVDDVARPRDVHVAAKALARLGARAAHASFLGGGDRVLLRAGALLAPALPHLVVPAARLRLRRLVGHLVADAGPGFGAHLARARNSGYTLNVNLLGEAVLGEDEARSRLARTIALVERPDVDYVSVKVSSVAEQLVTWDLAGSSARVVERLLPLYRAARDHGVFVNLDMEEYRDLALTTRVFQEVLGRDELAGLEAGIVLQAYLPDALGALDEITRGATARVDAGGAPVKVRLVKGANLAMERVEAELHGWPQAPYPSKAEVDANYLRIIDAALRPSRTRAVRLGVASHNLFDVAAAVLVARSRGVGPALDVEMLQGMAPGEAAAVRDEVCMHGGRVVLYTPAVRAADFDVAVSYLMRRLEENASPQNYLYAATSPARPAQQTAPPSAAPPSVASPSVAAPPSAPSPSAAPLSAPSPSAPSPSAVSPSAVAAVPSAAMAAQEAAFRASVRAATPYPPQAVTPRRTPRRAPRPHPTTHPTTPDLSGGGRTRERRNPDSVGGGPVRPDLSGGGRAGVGGNPDGGGGGSVRPELSGGGRAWERGKPDSVGGGSVRPELSGGGRAGVGGNPDGVGGGSVRPELSGGGRAGVGGNPDGVGGGSVRPELSGGGRARMGQNPDSGEEGGNAEDGGSAEEWGGVGGGGFANAVDTDPAVDAHRAWARAVVDRERIGYRPAQAAPLETTAAIDDAVARAVAAQQHWGAVPAEARARALEAVAERLEERRTDLVAAMVHEAGKTVAEADPEVSEAVDFANYYARCARALDTVRGATFTPDGVTLVTPPWNFPVAIPVGGVLAALAAGSAVLAKPASPTPRCLEVAIEAIHAGLADAGLADAAADDAAADDAAADAAADAADTATGAAPERPSGAPEPTAIVQYLRVSDRAVARHLVTHDDVARVVLTGSIETAELFARWKPARPVLAETSGKNALIVTPSADLDLAVADLVRSAFGHAGQKCSAASLAILVGSVGDPSTPTGQRLRRQLVDAVRSLQVGPATDLATVMGPLTEPAAGKLERALTMLERGESWLVRPRRLDDEANAAGLDPRRLWTPGLRDGVAPGSFFHLTEVFGPVLGLMTAATLDDAIVLANQVSFGLTAGLHSLDDDEIATWCDRIEAGNLYVGRHITGAIVGRQPFGGWKASSVGPGAKAGGPHYVAQLGAWSDGAGVPSRTADPAGWLAWATADDVRVWAHLSRPHDPSGLTAEENTFRMRPLDRVTVRVGDGALPVEVARVVAAGRLVGGAVVVVPESDSGWGMPIDRTATHEEFAAQVASGEVTGRVRVVGTSPGLRAAASSRLGTTTVLDHRVTASGERELLTFLREQVVSRTRHRYGHVHT